MDRFESRFERYKRKRSYDTPRHIFSRRRKKTALWQWKIFLLYIGAMVLILIVLPFLLVGGGRQGEDPAVAQWQDVPPEAGEGGELSLQIYMVESGEMAEMDLEVYIAGVVAAEMPAAFHAEALKAQAVAARTFALQKALQLGGRGCARFAGADLCTDSTCCQAWNGDAAQAMAQAQAQTMAQRGAEGPEQAQGPERAMAQAISERPYAEPRENEGAVGMINNLNRPFPTVLAAVEATRGLVLKYNGALIQAVYHSTCGGMTAAAGEVWGWDIPYLQPVKHPYCRHSPHYRQNVRMELSAFLAAIGIETGDRAAVPVLAGREPVMEVLRHGASGRNLLLRLPPRTPERTLSGTELRRLLGLPSTHFQWQVEEDEVVFHMRGFGHGVGLCQYGADGMGQAGYSFAEILKHFYQGALISEHNEN